MKVVFNNIVYDLYKEFCRLKGYKLPTSTLEQMIDTATKFEEARMQEFASWFFAEIVSRIEPVTPPKEDKEKGEV